MDLGEPFKRGMNIHPGEDGTFIVNVLGNTNGLKSTLGFTTIDDLLIWMAKHGAKSRVTELKEGDVVKPYPVALDRLMEAVHNAAPTSGLRRTIAANTLAERLEASRQQSGEGTGGNPSTPAA